MADTPAKKVPSLQELVGNKDESKDSKSTPSKSTPAKASPSRVSNKESDTKKEEVKENDENTEGVESSPTVKEEDIDASLNAKDDRVDPEDEDKSDTAPGHGIISEKIHEDDDNEEEPASLDVGVRSRINKMSPPGMTHLTTHSGGSETIEHDRLDVVVKPLAEAENKAHRVIIDETGKSRLLHPEVTEPNVPSEQATVMTTSKTHVYATPVDPEA
jgi:hypothetical protein